MTNITINEIEQMFRLIITKLKNEGFDKIDFDENEYWVISADEMFDFSHAPSPSVGSLNDDVNYMKKAIEEGAVYSYSELDRLASLLKVISEKQAPSIIKK
ncbi:MAG: hypothetical protein PHD73_11775 [Sediminibacterium sp.]|nr:hypothetical protein [Sediminibacterium sp.]